MLNNAFGFRKVYIAAGYTDLRRGIDGLAFIVKFNFQLIHTKRISSSCSVEEAVTASKGLYGKGTDSFFFIKDWNWAVSDGPVQKKEALEITPEQYRALMQGVEIVFRHPIQEVQPGDLL